MGARARRELSAPGRAGITPGPRAGESPGDTHHGALGAVPSLCKTERTESFDLGKRMKEEQADLWEGS